MKERRRRKKKRRRRRRRRRGRGAARIEKKANQRGKTRNKDKYHEK